MDGNHSRHKVIDESRLIEKPGFAGNDEFRNACDGWGKHDFSARHRFHEDERKALAAAGEYDNVGAAVERVKLFALDVTEESYSLFETKFLNQ